MRRTARLLVIIVACGALAGCGGPSREEWAAAVSAACTKGKAADEQLQVRAKSARTPQELHALLDESMQLGMRTLSEFEAVELPKDDANAAAWIALQRESLPIGQQLVTAIKTEDKESFQQASVRMVEFAGRDRQAATGLGLHADCIAEDPAAGANAA